MEKPKPIRKFQAGCVRASIWESEISMPNGEKRNMPRICVERRYKNDQGEWRSTSYFNVHELAKLQAVIPAAFDFVVLTERGNGNDRVLRIWKLPLFLRV